ncbi:MAG: DUF3842 family protein [Clostridiales bacterium]|nr:DUF3842 family protein [Clostridiales bacterium]
MKATKILLIDGQGGKIGSALIESLNELAAKENLKLEITAVGTNSIATANMLKSSPDTAATGENPVIVGCRNADFIAGPIGIVIADSLGGEVTPSMAVAVAQSQATRVLIPVNKCSNIVVGTTGATLAALIREAVEIIRKGIDS